MKTKMQNKKLFFFYVLIISIISACGKSEREIKQENEIATSENLKVINSKSKIALNNKYNAISKWDTINGYSYKFQQIFTGENKRLLSFNGEIKDIIKNSDTTFLLKISDKYFFSKSILFAKINVNNFEKLEKLLNSSNHNNCGTFIINVTNFSSSITKLDIETEYEEESANSFLQYDIDEKYFVFKGDIVDFQIETINPIGIE